MALTRDLPDSSITNRITAMKSGVLFATESPVEMPGLQKMAFTARLGMVMAAMECSHISRTMKSLHWKSDLYKGGNGYEPTKKES